MKLSRFFGKKSLSSRPNAEKKSEWDGSNNAEEDAAVIEWEVRPGGMLVQKRRLDACLGASPSSGPLIKVRVSHGHLQHDVIIPAYATFEDLKSLLVQEVGLQPHEQRLIFQGKEKDGSEFLHIAGVKDTAKLILVEDPASKEKRLQEMKLENDNAADACQAIALIRSGVDKLAEQVSALDGIVGNGGKVPDTDFNMIADLLMQQWVELDRIHTEGEAKVQKKVEGRRLQAISEHLENIRLQNRKRICTDSVVITTHWETFDSGSTVTTTPIQPPPSAPATISTTWEVF